MAQRPDSPLPFTAQEYYRALRLFVPDSEALLVARVMSGEIDDTPEPTGVPASGGFVSDDVLIVMSLLSDETRNKVEQYRREYDPRYGQPEEQRKWEARREEMKRLIDSGVIKPPE